MKKHIRSANDRMIALVVLISLTVIAVGGVLGVYAMVKYNIYNDKGVYAWSVGRDEITKTAVNEIQQEYYAYLIASNYNADDALPVLDNKGYEGDPDIRISSSVIKKYSEENCNFAFKVKDASDTVLWYNYDPASAGSKAKDSGQNIDGTTVYQYTPVYGFTYFILGSTITDAGNIPVYSEGEIKEVFITIEIYLLSPTEKGEWPASDDFSTVYWWIMTAVSLRYAVFAVIGLASLLIFMLLVMITNGAGLTADPNSDEIVPGFIDRSPLDVNILIAVGICIACIVAMRLTGIANSGIVIDNVVIIFGSCVIMIVIVNLLETLSVRIKLGEPGKNTLIYLVYSKIKQKISPKDKEQNKKTGISYTGKLVILVVLFSLMLLAILTYFAYRYFVLGASQIKFEYYIIIWLAAMIVVVPLVIMFVTNFGYIRDAGQKIASGDLDSTDVSSRLSIKAMRDHGENLDHIRRDMAKAMEQEMKDERFRNELISNISHDIRTPLTSINSFVELLGSPDITEEQRKQYLEILQRQVSNLNGLTKDLMDISKFSTGNVEVHLELMDIGVAVEQMVGEYYYALRKNSIEIEIQKEEKEYPVMADGNMLGRVITNLMTNVRKYAMPSTRVYVRVKDENGRISIMFRNVSKDLPNLSGEELSERLVRGDRSRHTEGSGLGLSIAKSLTELQHGTFNVDVDGDLFTVTLEFERANKQTVQI
ncbi:MAG: HAMP domain-containing histidine kinase [Clostridia bacterium]|nr:HAMP domain-containing histidine kinase [Clostridia bacterium]